MIFKLLILDFKEFWSNYYKKLCLYFYKGRSSARETIGRVFAGALANCYLRKKLNIEIVSWVSQVGEIEIPKDYQNYLSINN